MTRLLRLKLRLATARAASARAAAAQADARLQRTRALHASFAPEAGVRLASDLATRDRFAARLDHACGALGEAAARGHASVEPCAIATRRAERALAHAVSADAADIARRARRRGSA